MPARDKTETLFDLKRERHSASRKDPKLERRRRDLLQHWSEHPRNWLWGTDDTSTEVHLPNGEILTYPNGRPLCWTQVEEADEGGAYQPWPSPKKWPHLVWLLDEVHDPGFQGLVGDKSRRMMFTTLVLRYFDWCCRFQSGRKYLWSKITEDQAIEQLEEKVRAAHRLLPQWVRERLPLTESPLNMVRYPKTGSRIRAVSQTAAGGECRGGGATGIGIDEAAFQEYAPDILAASREMARKWFLFSTPEVKGRGARLMKTYLDMPDLRHGPSHEGFAVRYVSDPDGTPPWKGVVKVVEVDDVAVPERRLPKWRTALVAQYPLGEDDPDYKREHLRNWSVGKGDSFFPLFARNPEKYILRGDEAGLVLGGQVMVRGRDFGERRPACVWLQQDPATGRIFVLREWLGNHIGAHDARDLIAYASGELPLQALKDGALREVERLDRAAQAGKWPTLPWLPIDPGRPWVFADWSSYEALKTYASVETERQEKTDADILAARGVQLRMFHASPKIMAKALRYLMRDFEDGMPGILVSEWCPLTIEALAGALQYPRPTVTDPEPDPGVWAKNGVHDNIVEALGHAVVNLVDLADVERKTTEAERVRLDGRYEEDFGYMDGGSDE